MIEVIVQRSIAVLGGIALAIAMNSSLAAADAASAASSPTTSSANSSSVSVPPAAPSASSASVNSASAVATTMAPATTVATAPASVAAPASSPTSFAGSFQMLFGLLVVMALLFGATWLLKKYGPVRPGAASTVKIIGGVSVGNRERIIVVEVADQWIVVGVAPGRVNTLSTMPKQESVDVQQSAPPEKNFAAWLKQTIDKRNGK